MKKTELTKRLSRMGWYLTREGGNHEVWTDGVNSVYVPRHAELKEFTALGILKQVEKYKK
ncbi:MAG: type II toxin-antitoxin system HicA family toxin [Nitrospinae bacterium]|nr:type II toxin-antitoxin system HicA family toxin [Nitrospinota bacterium]